MLSFVIPASFKIWRVRGVIFSGWSSIPMPWVMIKCSWMASMISFMRSAARAGVPPPKYRLVTIFFPGIWLPARWISRIRASMYRLHASSE